MRVEKLRRRLESGESEILTQVQGTVYFDGGWDVTPLQETVNDNSLVSLAFDDPAFFRDHGRAIAMCEEMRVRGINILWTARMDTVPTGGLLKAMRLAGCQSLDMYLDPEEAVEGLFWGRHYGFELRLRNVDGAPYTAERITYSVADREAIAERLPGLHSAQFDLAVAYYKARRLENVMLPLGKAMTLGFPMNELCLNLLACLSAAKHYPEQVAGLLDQAGYGCPHPVVFRNKELLKSWLQSGGDLKGMRLELDTAGSTTHQ